MPAALYRAVCRLYRSGDLSSDEAARSWEILDGTGRTSLPVVRRSYSIPRPLCPCRYGEDRPKWLGPFSDNTPSYLTGEVR